jgi:hypothetical protein
MYAQMMLHYLYSSYQYLNTVLNEPSKIIKNFLSLRTESLPNFLHAPFNFVSVLSLLFFIFLSFANNFMCNLVGIIYPLVYGFNFLNEKTSSSSKYISMNKYWMIYGAYLFLESLFKCLLVLVPGYYYLKLVSLYMLVRNDFSLSEYTYDYFRTVIDNSNWSYYLQNIFNFLMEKISSVVVMIYDFIYSYISIQSMNSLQVSDQLMSEKDTNRTIFVTETYDTNSENKSLNTNDNNLEQN